MTQMSYCAHKANRKVFTKVRTERCFPLTSVGTKRFLAIAIWWSLCRMQVKGVSILSLFLCFGIYIHILILSLDLPSNPSVGSYFFSIV